MTYFTPAPTTCFTDAGTTPATVGSLVHDVVSSYGPSFTFRQTTEGNRPTLRQSGSGKYYLEFAATRFMISTGNVTTAINEPATLATAFNPVAWVDGAFHAYLSLGSAAAGQYRALWKSTADQIVYVTHTGNRVADQSDGTVSQSLIVNTATGATVAIYRNGVALSVTGSGSHAAGSATNVRLGHDGDLYTSAWHCYGIGWRLGTAALTAGQVASLDAYQRELYA